MQDFDDVVKEIAAATSPEVLVSNLAEGRFQTPRPTAQPAASDIAAKNAAIASVLRLARFQFAFCGTGVSSAARDCGELTASVETMSGAAIEAVAFPVSGSDGLIGMTVAAAPAEALRSATASTSGGCSALLDEPLAPGAGRGNRGSNEYRARSAEAGIGADSSSIHSRICVRDSSGSSTNRTPTIVLDSPFQVISPATSIGGFDADGRKLIFGTDDSMSGVTDRTASPLSLMLRMMPPLPKPRST